MEKRTDYRSHQMLAMMSESTHSMEWFPPIEEVQPAAVEEQQSQYSVSHFSEGYLEADVASTAERWLCLLPIGHEDDVYITAPSTEDAFIQRSSFDEQSIEESVISHAAGPPGDKALFQSSLDVGRSPSPSPASSWFLPVDLSMPNNDGLSINSVQEDHYETIIAVATWLNFEEQSLHFTEDSTDRAQSAAAYFTDQDASNGPADPAMEEDAPHHHGDNGGGSNSTVPKPADAAEALAADILCVTEDEMLSLSIESGPGAALRARLRDVLPAADQRGRVLLMEALHGVSGGGSSGKSSVSLDGGADGGAKGETVGGSIGGAGSWMVWESAATVQRAVRCRHARRRLRTQQERRGRNTQTVDWDAAVREYLHELETTDVKDEAALDAIWRRGRELRQLLPHSYGEEVISGLRMGTAHGFQALRNHCAAVLQLAYRCHVARALVGRNRVLLPHEALHSAAISQENGAESMDDNLHDAAGPSAETEGLLITPEDQEGRSPGMAPTAENTMDQEQVGGQENTNQEQVGGQILSASNQQVKGAVQATNSKEDEAPEAKQEILESSSPKFPASSAEDIEPGLNTVELVPSVEESPSIQLDAAMRNVDEVVEASRKAWSEALAAEKELVTLVEEGVPREVIRAAEENAAALRKRAAELNTMADDARMIAMQAEDFADAAKDAEIIAEALKQAEDIEHREIQESEELLKAEEAERLKQERERLESEEKRRLAARQEILRKEALQRRDERRRRDTAAAAQSKAVEERAEIARKTLKLDFSALGISDIPDFVYADPLLKHVRILWLNQNEFETLPAEIASLQYLTQLRVFQNKLRFLPPEIGNLDKLQILWLQDNLLVTLPPEIERLTSLTLLSLKGNPLKVLPVELSRLKRMREMELDTDSLTFPPPAISRAGTRQVQDFLRRADRAWVNNKLDLSSMDLDCLPLDIVQLFPRIERLWIMGNPIPKVPFEFSAMTQLTDLRFDSESMVSPSLEIWALGLPRALDFMGKFLSYRTNPKIDLRGWQLCDMPSEIFEPELGPQVTVVDFAQNRIKEVPPAIEILQCLTTLLVDDNLLQTFPKAICLLSSLTLLSATGNQLIGFPDLMGNMVNLTDLRLDRNRIGTLPSSIMHVRKLKNFSISHNRISDLPPELPRITSLRSLDVQDNLIERLPLEYGAFTFLSRLQVGGNPIWSPPKDILNQGKHIWFLYLQRLMKSLKLQSVPLDGRTLKGGVLELSRFEMTEFPPEVARFPSQFLSIIQINMDGNHLSTLPKEVGKLSNITVLSLAKNSFRACPSILGKLYNLTEVNFERNLLTYLPIEIGNLTALKKLRVEGNRFTHPPMEIIKLGVSFILRFLKVFSQGSGSGEVTMSGCNLRTFPLAVTDIENLTRLDLSHNSIGRIPYEFFHNQTVKYLDLSYNSLAELEPGIEGLVNLRTLRVAGNRISSIVPTLFTLKHLEVLNFNQNLISYIPPQMGLMTWLRELKISNNDIYSLPLEIGRMVSLQRLNLAYNNIDSVPTTIGNLTALRDLSVVGNCLSCLPPILGVMTGLSTLAILDNELDRHPVEVVEAAKEMQATRKAWHDGSAPVSPLCLWLARVRAARITKALDASKFGLAEVPSEVLQMSTLQLLYLGLEHNHIKVLPASIAALITLTSLDLSHNKLKAIPPVIGGMSNLTVLYLNNNKIARLPIEIGHLPSTNLTRLSISHNRLETPPKELTTHSTANILRYYSTSEIAILTGDLDWSWCKSLLNMQSICHEVVNWQHLVSMHLDNNEISTIHWEICMAMDRLEVLELRRNRLTSIPDGLCAHTRLRTLAVSFNRIARLPIALQSMRSLANLEVAGMALASPPREVVRYGTENILAYLGAVYLAYATQVCIMNRFDLSEIPAEVLEMRHATVLELDYMRLSALPPALTGLTTLTRLSFCNNAVSELPAFVAHLTALAELELEANRVTCLLPEHHMLTGLTHLNVRHNPLRTPPSEVLQTMEAHHPPHDRHHTHATQLQPHLAHPLGGDAHGMAPPAAPSPLPERPPGAGRHPDYPRHELRPERVLAFLRALYLARNGELLELCNFGLGLWPAEALDTPHIVRLNLDGNNIRFVGPEVRHLTALQEMSVEHNSLRSLVGEIGDVTTLRVLRLSHNQIEELPSTVAALANLEMLVATDNLISVLPTALFLCTNLRTLAIERNKLTELPPEFGSLKKLESLTYAGNPIIIPPEEIRFQGVEGLLRFYQQIMSCAPACSLRGLECEAAGFELDLRGFSLLALPDVVHRGMPRPGGSWDDPPNRFRRDRWAFGMTHLTRLQLDNNSIAELPALISRCVALRQLSAAHNQLAELPPTITGLHSLQELDLRDNLLEVLPQAMSRLDELRILMLDGNRLRRLPDGLGKLPELHTLQAGQNLLASLPVDLCETSSLRTLEMEGNPLRMPPNEVVARGLRHIMDWLGRLLRCRQTNTLDLRGLTLSSIDYEVLPIDNVRRILLTNNQLTTISSNPMSADGRARSSADGSAGVGGTRAGGGPPSGGGSGILPMPRTVQSRGNTAPSNGSPTRAPTAATRTSAEGGEADHRRGSEERINTAMEIRSTTASSSGMGAVGSHDKLRYLEYLNVDDNLLDEMPESVALLTSLVELSLRNNRISQLPPTVSLLTNLKKLYLANNHLTALPVELAALRTTLRKLDLDGNQLEMPPPEVCAAGTPTMMQYLEDLASAHRTLSLDAVGFRFRSIPPEILQLTELQRLVLDENAIEVLPVELYYGITALTHLSLSRNRIEILPRAMCERLTALRTLRLDGNCIALLPLQICRMAVLEELLLQLNNVSILPLELGALSRLHTLGLDTAEMISPAPEICARGARAVIYYLRSLDVARRTGAADLRAMGLTAFPVEVLAVTGITSLHLDDNCFTSLPAALGRLTSLTELTLTRLPVAALPHALGACSALTSLRVDASRRFRSPPYEVVMRGTAAVLDYLRKTFVCAQASGYVNLSHAGLEGLPVELLSLPNLRHLQARDNQVQYLPAEVAELHAIEVLHLHRNNIVVLPPEIGRLATLVVLRLPSNRLRVLPTELGDCYSLQKLTLRDNLLATLPAAVLSGLSGLVTLNASRNQIVTIPSAVGDMHSLQKLRLDQNQLRSIPSAVGRCTSLTLLSLTCNLLAGLPDALVRCTGLTALHMSANRMRQLPRCIEALTELRWLWAANNELVGLPTCLAGLPNLYELQVNGCNDLRYPPPDVVAEGLEAVRAYLLCNMQYEDPPKGPSPEEEEAAAAEARARDDIAVAEAAALIIKPLRALAEDAEDAAEAAEARAVQLRRAADGRQALDPIGAIIRDLSLDDRGRAAALELATSIRDEEEDVARQAEAEAGRRRAEASAAAARAAEAALIFGALSEMAAESEATAQQLRAIAAAPPSRRGTAQSSRSSRSRG